MSAAPQTSDREWLLAAARGEIWTPAALRAVAVMRADPHLDEELAAALVEGDERYPLEDHPERYEVIPPGPVPVEGDPDADEAYRALQEADPEQNGELVLDELARFIGRFVAFPSPDELTATVLWTAHTWMVDRFESTPRLALLSPEPGSGKTRVLEVVELLVPSPLHALNASPAALFRLIESGRPTLLLDEVDAVFRSRGKSDDGSEELRGLLNSGHRIGATVPRCVGPTHEVRQFPVFCAVAMAGLGDLPDTLMSRSVIVRMRRRAPNEKVEQLRLRIVRPEADALRDQLQTWARSVAHECGQAWPTMPDGVTDRAADVWEPLLAVADAAGGAWPKLARDAAQNLNKVRDDAQTLGVKLLADIRQVMPSGAMSSAQLAEKLAGIEEAPWGDWFGKPVDARWLAKKLKPYGIAPKLRRIDDKPSRSYAAEDFTDAWTRYLPSPETVTSDTSVTDQVSSTRDVTPVTDVTLFPEGPTP